MYQNDDTFFSTALTNQPRNPVFDYKNLQTSNENPLTHTALKQLEMHGFLSSDLTEKRWGLIQLPDKKIYKVERGDKIGLEQACITSIDRKKIVLREKNGEKTVLSFQK